MKIGLDYGGVISRDPNTWAETIRKLVLQGHEVFLVSHVGRKCDYDRHHRYALSVGMEDLSFVDDVTDKREIAEHKGQVCRDNGIELFLDNDLERAEAVGRICRGRCVAIYVHRKMWQVGLCLIDGLEEA